MRRREFIALIGGAAAAWPLAARGQQPRRVGVLIGLGEDDAQTKSYLAAFREALRSLGWIDGRAVQIEHRAAPDLDGLRSGAAELLKQGPDVLVTFPTPATIASFDRHLRTCGSYSLACLIQSGQDL
jgi:putative ABC transport system substrate-binding protein